MARSSHGCDALVRLLAVSAALAFVGAAEPPIDRHALVTRHNPVLRRVDYEAPLSVGNGGFAFTVDITGLQTFPNRYYERGIPLETLSRWAWVTDPNSHGFTLADTNRNFRTADGRVQAFPTDADSPTGEWLRRNPRDLPLGQLALEWLKDDRSAFVPEDVKNLDQMLDLWSGTIVSRYKLGGAPVTVTTTCDPGSDSIAVRIESSLVGAGRLRVRLAFPRGHDASVKNTPPLDWSHPELHESRLVSPAVIERRDGGARYFVVGDRPMLSIGPHVFQIRATPGARELAFALTFTPRSGAKPAAFATIAAASAAHWRGFWEKAAALDLSGSSNPLAAKLEGRVILSQYLTAIQLAGAMPPQETGLTCSSWYGKHHTEMIWWHAAHFALWTAGAPLARNLEWYQAHLPDARALAQSRGLRGARWPKMVGPDARESPGGNPLIVWNQPHPIYLAELLYRLSPTPATLARYRDLVLETAEAAASMATFDPARGCYVLGPPLWIAQEIHDPATSRNPCFELAYWRWALGVAQQWRVRLGLPRDARWDDVISRLAPLPERGGRYVAVESHPDTWDNPASRHDHPAMLMALGFLPAAPGVDPATMNRTLDAVLAGWDWQTKIWGWDYPMIAMTATRLGRPQTAMEVLLRDGPCNRYTAAGHCPQPDDSSAPRPGGLAVYLPANGAFLSAVALMTAGWDGCTRRHPGFPDDGTWRVRAEGWQPLP